MTDLQSMDQAELQAIHRKFSAECYNKTWGLIDKNRRTAEEEEEMLRLTMASHWHWTNRGDYAPKNASIANWQIARVFALLGQPENARRYASRALEAVSTQQGLDFYRGFAYEALARAEALAGNHQVARQHLERAREAAALVEDQESKKMLLDDLETIPS